MEGTLLTAVIKAQEGQDVATCKHPKCICPNPCGGEGQRRKSNHHEDKGSLGGSSVKLIPFIGTTW